MWLATGAHVDLGLQACARRATHRCWAWKTDSPATRARSAGFARPHLTRTRDSRYGRPAGHAGPGRTPPRQPDRHASLSNRSVSARRRRFRWKEMPADTARAKTGGRVAGQNLSFQPHADRATRQESRQTPSTLPQPAGRRGHRRSLPAASIRSEVEGCGRFIVSAVH